MGKIFKVTKDISKDFGMKETLSGNGCGGCGGWIFCGGSMVFIINFAIALVLSPD